MSYPDKPNLLPALGNNILRILKYILIFLLYLVIASFFLKVTEASAPDGEITIQDYAFLQVKETWSEEEWQSFNTLIIKESEWDALAQNPKSTAFGIGQFLDNTWKTVGCIKTIDERKQVDCTIKYIKQRYGSPQKALAFHLLNNHY